MYYTNKVDLNMNTGVIFNIRYLLFNLLGLIAFCIRKVLFSLYHKLNKYNLTINKIAVCGRGLQLIFSLKKNIKFIVKYI